MEVGVTRIWDQLTSFHCQLCGTGPSNKGTILRHIKECSEQQLTIIFAANQCQLCKNAFLSKELLLVHINTCSTEQLQSYEIQITTNVCQTPTTTPQMTSENIGRNLYMMQQDMNKKMIRPGTEAENTNEYYNNVDRNEVQCAEIKQEEMPGNDSSKIEHESPKNQCKLCGRIFANFSILNRHDEAVHQGKAFKCNPCERTFMTLRSLKIHYESVHDCNLCGKTFTEQKHLNAHNITKHKRNEETAGVHKTDEPSMQYSSETENVQAWESFDGSKKPLVNEQDNIEHPKAKIFPPERLSVEETLSLSLSEAVEYTRRLKCYKCGREFEGLNLMSRGKGKLIIHLSSHFDKEICSKYMTDPNKCSFCRRTFSSKTEKKSHVVLRHRILEEFLEPEIASILYPTNVAESAKTIALVNNGRKDRSINTEETD